MDPFKILGVDRKATLKEIKQKYKQLANQHHPDKGGDEETFKLINLAYDILCDPIKKQNYIDSGVFYNDSTIHNDARIKVENLFLHFFSSHNPIMDDLLFMIMREIENQNQQVQGHITNCKNAISKLKLVKSKIHLKEGIENILENAINKTLDSWNLDIIKMDRELKVNEVSINILKNYHYGTGDWAELIEYFSGGQEQNNLAPPNK